MLSRMAEILAGTRVRAATRITRSILDVGNDVKWRNLSGRGREGMETMRCGMLRTRMTTFSSGMIGRTGDCDTIDYKMYKSQSKINRMINQQSPVHSGWQRRSRAAVSRRRLV